MRRRCKLSLHNKGVTAILKLAIAEIAIGIIIFIASLYNYMWGGKGSGFKIYAGVIMAINLIIALSR